jgi:hypothetical protein
VKRGGDRELVIAVVRWVRHERSGEVQHAIDVAFVTGEARIVLAGAVAMRVEDLFDEGMGGEGVG